MDRRNVNTISPVKVTHSVDTWAALLNTLQQSLSGKYIVTVHNGQVTKVEPVDRAVKITMEPHPKGTIPGP